MTRKEAYLIAGIELLFRYQDQCERYPDMEEKIPLSLYLANNIHDHANNVLARETNGNQAS